MGCGAATAENPYRNLSPINGPITLYLTPSVTSTCKQYGGPDENSLALGGSAVSEISIDQFGTKRLALQTKENESIIFEVAPNGKELQSKMFFKSGDSYQEIPPNSFNSGPPETKQMLEILKKMTTARLGIPIRQGDKYPLPDFCAAMGGRSPSLFTKTPSATWSGKVSINGREALVAVGDNQLSCSLAGKTISIRFKGWYSYDILSGLDAGSYEEASLEEKSSGVFRLISKTECELTNTGQLVASKTPQIPAAAATNSYVPTYCPSTNSYYSGDVKLCPEHASGAISVGNADAQNVQQKAIQAQLEEERRKLAEERSKLEAEKAQREQAKLASRISVQASASQPNADGEFVINIQTSADTASLKIDDEEQGANKSGVYSVRRVARVGITNNITITAKDIYGNTDTKTISIARQAVDSRPTFARLNPASIKPQPARDAVAIIIGIQNYKLIPKAEYASQDAQVFYDYASRALGIKQENIKLLLDDDADVSGILTAFQEWLPLKVRKGKTDVYVFYSGHGLPGADGKSLYFLPVGTNKNLLAKTGISQREIVDALKSAQAKSVTMFIDSCYSGQIRTGETLLASARPVVLTVQETAYPPEFTVITASASDQIASSSPDLKHGIFSYYLMKGLEGEADENKDGTITVGKLQSYLAERVPRFAMTMSRKQEPQLIGDGSRVLISK